jgi:hypothetical protein
MGSMRAIFVLATILSFATPQVSWTAAALARDASPSISLTGPAASSQLIRAVAAKTDKGFSAGAAIAGDRPALFPPLGSIDGVVAGTSEAPNLDLQGPPLAPRPPPLS